MVKANMWSGIKITFIIDCRDSLTGSSTIVGAAECSQDRSYEVQKLKRMAVEVAAAATGSRLVAAVRRAEVEAAHSRRPSHCKRLHPTAAWAGHWCQVAAGLAVARCPV